MWNQMGSFEVSGTYEEKQRIQIRRERQRTRHAIVTTEQRERRLSKKGKNYKVQQVKTTARERKAESKKGRPVEPMTIEDRFT